MCPVTPTGTSTVTLAHAVFINPRKSCLGGAFASLRNSAGMSCGTHQRISSEKAFGSSHLTNTQSVAHDGDLHALLALPHSAPHCRHNDLFHSLCGAVLEIIEAFAPGKLLLALGDYRECPLRVLLRARLGFVGLCSPRFALRDTKILLTKQRGGRQRRWRDLGLARLQSECGCMCAFQGGGEDGGEGCVCERNAECIRLLWGC